VRAWPVYVDAVTGEEVSKLRPGAVFSHLGVPIWKQGQSTDSPPTWVRVERSEVEAPQTYYETKSNDYEHFLRQAQEQWAREAAEKKKGRQRPTRKQAVPGMTETYRNARQGVDQFLAMNGDFVYSLGNQVNTDHVNDFLDSFEVRRGRPRKDGSYSHKRLNTTKKGKEILSEFKRGDAEGARAFLTWLFSRNRGKRWADVDWAAVDSLGELLLDACHTLKDRFGEGSCGGWVWYPPAAGLTPLEERLEDLTPKAREQIENQTYTERLGALVKDLRASLKKAKNCLPPDTQKTIRARIAYLAKLAKEPWRIERMSICGADPESGYQFCGFPAIESEVTQLRKACEFGYDPDWPLAQGLSTSAAADFGLPVASATDSGPPIEVEGRPITLEELEAIPFDTIENPGGKMPPSPGTLDAAGKRMLWTVYEEAKSHYQRQGERGARLKQLAARVAWAEVKRHYFKRGKKWTRRKRVLPREPGALDLRQRALPLKSSRRKGGSKTKRAASSRRSTRSNPKPRNPYGELLDLRARVVELEIELPDGRVEVHTWNVDRPALFWSEKRRALVWVHGGRDPSRFVDAEISGPVAARHRKWHGEHPTEIGEVELPAGRVTKMGPALRIVYSAERYRDGRMRHHDFGAGVAAYSQKSSGARVFEVRGGRLTLNDRGLVF